MRRSMRSALALALGLAACTVRHVAAQTPTHDQLIAQGALSYVFYCAACHGGNAGGDPARHVPALAGGSASLLARELAELQKAARAAGGKDSGHHAGAFAQLNAEDIERIAEYLSSLAPPPPAAQ
jgi:cytochrome c553